MSQPCLTPAFCAANGIVVMRHEGKSVFFGMLDPGDTVLKTRVSKAFPGFHCAFEELESETFSLRLSQLYSEEGPCESGGGGGEGESGESAIDRVADDSPIINLLNSIFLEALSKSASDIHIESGCDGTMVRYRIDGLLISEKRIASERAIGVSARLKLLANLNVLEIRRPQDGHIEIKTDSYSLDVRVSIVPTIWGESIVLRLLNRSDSPISIGSLGFSKANEASLKGLCGIKSGLVLVTGPTGSGKTTTMAALLKELDVKSTKIVSIEDPVEYRIPGVTQIQVHEELGLTFDALLRRIFRQDPDVIMVGEIRDIETAELAVRAALTGHLVFATLHTNTAIEAVYRLKNMGIPAYMVAAVLKAAVAQRLVRKACHECGASGCACCSHTGFKGRTAIAEFIPVDSALSDMISGDAAMDQLRRYLQGNGFKPIWDDAGEKAASGITTEAEIKRELGVRQ